MKFTALSLAIALAASGAHAEIYKKPPPNNITPHLVANFPWKDPFPIKESDAVEPSCEVAKHFFAREYTLHELMEEPPRGLKPWADGLKKLFSSREYPGGWSGYDRHGYDRSILKMDYADIPLALREWIEEQERTEGEWKGLFGVFRDSKGGEDTVDDVVDVKENIDRSQDKDRVVMFAPAAVYHVLPLWVAEESDCKDQLLDLSNYKPEPADGTVVGWADHKRPKDDKTTEFRVSVKALKQKTVPSASEGVKKEEL
ncbi:uncharacterized protein F5Z01DRAFT_265041 [Emericellopsis atlantica]|uniref:Uncharacterized protein n=1 Tax=Emericellopsis atlantica TaxID=2614577 RepID=A0A9P8CLT7_9HYPO|nr:uncharacterized protein F5Z01DRAFT_265041 [Emericellopsis atlantica]KAG9251743.1 hypothetical protein F5Z01DRAFT_265041 [Emericellopsis atlantica]